MNLHHLPHHYNYDIDLRDIWEYEREVFFSNANSSVEAAEELLAEIRKLIIEADPPRGKKKGQLPEYTFTKNYDQYLNKSNSFSDEFRLNYFFIGDTFYSFMDRLIIEKGIKGFDFWFALKLRHYEFHLFDIDKFLFYQLEKNYANKKSSLIDFLKLLLLQYGENHIFSAKVFQAIQNWIVSAGSKSEKSNISSPPSFKLIQIQLNNNYLRENRLHLIGILKELKDARFIDKNCNPDHFIAILSGKEIEKAGRVNWTASFKLLNCFVNLLIDLQKVQEITIGKWHTAMKCFIKNGKEINEGQVKKPGDRAFIDQRLQQIVEKI
ncbi:MAG TPA: hypothetical protein PLN13_11770 [Bacteroidia bacterium]|nr:hypothetical protein [Bacteroidia bacterium]HRH09252.1 hypothetical protein [Bacteroidia bacterium]